MLVACSTVFLGILSLQSNVQVLNDLLIDLIPCKQSGWCTQVWPLCLLLWLQGNESLLSTIHFFLD